MDGSELDSSVGYSAAGCPEWWAPVWTGASRRGLPEAANVEVFCKL